MSSIFSVTNLTAPNKAAIAALKPAVLTSVDPSFLFPPSTPSRHKSKAGVRKLGTATHKHLKDLK